MLWRISIRNHNTELPGLAGQRAGDAAANVPRYAAQHQEKLLQPRADRGPDGHELQGHPQAGGILLRPPGPHQDRYCVQGKDV